MGVYTGWVFLAESCGLTQLLQAGAGCYFRIVWLTYISFAVHHVYQPFHFT
jgi:hypothetical protein